MKLSEAIFLGAGLAPQGFEVLESRRGYLCALGAAAKALGLSTLTYYDLANVYPWAFTRQDPRRCPNCNISARDISVMVTHLNDIHEWPRERIADWVATVEPVEAVSTQSEVMAPVCTEPAEMLHRR